MARWILLPILIGLLMVSCSDATSDTQACIDHYSVAQGYDYTETLSSYPPFVQMRDCLQDDAEACSLDALRQDCADNGGSDCDAQLISAAAAECIAEFNGLREGEGEYMAVLDYSDRAHRLVWTVARLTSSDDESQFSGHYLTIDAVDGTLIDSSHPIIAFD